jgi:tRNA (uracil-5-)-methyltransferase
MVNAESVQSKGISNQKKRQYQGRGPSKRRKLNSKPQKEGSTEEVLLKDVEALLVAYKISEPALHSKGDSSPGSPTSEHLPELYSEIELQIKEISSTGDGLALSSDSKNVYVVPFTTPGDLVRAKIYRHIPQHSHSFTDLIEILKPSSIRDDSLVKCKYFAKCSGCQLQMLPYSEQLKHKRTIVEKAYTNFSGLSSQSIPKVQDTLGSPLQYGYRTKLTPHFDGPPGYRSGENKRANVKKHFEQVPPIGFLLKGTRKTLDIEDCPIGTDVVRLGMRRERNQVVAELEKYTKGATILLRENTIRTSNRESENSSHLTSEIKVDEEAGTIISHTLDTTTTKSCITDSTAQATEYIGPYIFTNTAGSFFQNNNSILPDFASFIRSHILPRENDSTAIKKIKYLIDAYSGSGLFTITLSSLFTHSTGIDIDSIAIKAADTNAHLNNISKDRADFIAADASALFKQVDYNPEETVVILDPPRKGCDMEFLHQLMAFGAVRVVYVSCNVHTQARDVGVLVREGGYSVESLRGFDFFPQTGHVEGVAILRKEGNSPELEKDEIDKGE